MNKSDLCNKLSLQACFRTMPSDFTVAMVATFPFPWPPQGRVRFCEVPHKGDQIQMWGYGDGHVEVLVVHSDGSPDVTEQFQCIDTPSEPTKALIMISCGNGDVMLEINGIRLQTLASSLGKRFVLSPNSPTVAESSIGHPDAPQACSSWIAQRKHRFATRKPFVPKRTHRAKTGREQLADLETASRSLRDLLVGVSAGVKHLVPHVAAALRAMIYWPNLGPTWNPLLLRLANDGSLPLPVFALSDSGQPPGGPILHVRSLRPSIIREEATQDLMDLEGYLQLEVLTVRGPLGVSTLTAAEAVGSAASSQGASHYDETIQLDIERLGGLVFADTSALDRLIVGLASAVVALAEFVIDATLKKQSGT